MIRELINDTEVLNSIFPSKCYDIDNNEYYPYLSLELIYPFSLQYAVSYGTPIMSEKWIYEVWDKRNEENLLASSDDVMIKYRVPPFFKLCISFHGFPEDETKHMEELTVENGGVFKPLGDVECTHLVVDDQAIKNMPNNIMFPHCIIRAEWFWTSIQMEACADEVLYEFQKVGGIFNDSVFTPGHSMSGSKSRKRKRLKENIAQLADHDFDSPFKRRSSEFDRYSMSPNSFLDASNTPDKSDCRATRDYPEKLEDLNKDKSCTQGSRVSPRLQVVMEFLQTEKNYVSILNTILTVFKHEVEKPSQINGAILSSQHIKLIFGNIPPIYDVHCMMRDQLQNIVDDWKEDCSLGDIILNQADALTRAYPSFVNFFEQTKETIAKCDKTNPRFHAFLKVCQSKPECGRQTLVELLIRPVQRLPSISLLLNDILKHTIKDLPDYGKLEKAVNVLKEVMTYINEDKRRTESQVVMFEIMNDIDNCPPTLLSSHRQFVTRLDVTELSDDLCGKGVPLSLFLFTDSLEVCKRRTKLLNSSKSPALYKTPQKAYKHITLLPLASIKRVLNCLEAEACRNAFGLICKTNIELIEKLFRFSVDDQTKDKKPFLVTLTKNISRITCDPDPESRLMTVNGQDFHISTCELAKTTLSKAARLQKRVSRVFSFNRTPGKLRRAVSGITHSPLRDRREAHFNTPGGDLRASRLASCMDLTETGLTSPTLSSYASSATLYDNSDSISLGAYSLKDELS